MEFNPLDLSGRRYLITGAASGIGKATSILLSRLGAELLLVDLNAEGLQATQQSCPNPDFSFDCRSDKYGRDETKNK